MSIGRVTTRVPIATAIPPARVLATDEDSAYAHAQVIADPLRPPGANGWTPDEIVHVRSRNTGGIVGSAVSFALGGVEERPGQRLSTAQVDAIAPFYADKFQLDEGFVRRELAKVYIYVGGPSSEAHGAMTVGHHIFVPTDAGVDRILSPAGKRWLVHELSHTMQFLANEHGSPHTFLADYISALVVGHDPLSPGRSDGPLVWGSLFTGLASAGKTEDDLGRGAASFRERMISSVLPAAVVGVPTALVAGGLVAATRATTGKHLLGSSRGMTLGMGIIAAPAMAGAVAGSYEDTIGKRGAQILGGASGAAFAGLTLLRSGAFSAGGAHAITDAGRSLGRTAGLSAAVAGAIAGAVIGFTSATASANTIRGWSRSAAIQTDLRHRDPTNPEVAETLSYADTIHDAHWFELDAETLAQQYIRGDWSNPTPGVPIEGRDPGAPETLAGTIDTNLADRVDWGLKIPLLLGIPLAAGLGAGVLATRTGTRLFDATLREGRSPIEAVKEAVRQLADSRRGIKNSLGVGAALSVAPLMAGGIIGPLVYNATGSALAARLGGAGAGGATAGVLLTLLLRNRGGGLIATSGKVLAGMAVAAGVGFLAGGVATDALRPHERTYDVSAGTHAQLPALPAAPIRRS